MLHSQQRYILVCGTEVFLGSMVYYFTKATHIMAACEVSDILDYDGYFPKEETKYFSELFASKRDCIRAINKDKMKRLYKICQN
jgi:hypothetical protein